MATGEPPSPAAAGDPPESPVLPAAGTLPLPPELAPPLPELSLLLHAANVSDKPKTAQARIMRKT